MTVLSFECLSLSMASTDRRSQNTYSKNGTEFLVLRLCFLLQFYSNLHLGQQLKGTYSHKVGSKYYLLQV